LDKTHCLQVIIRCKPEDSSIECIQVQAGMDLGVEVGGGRKKLVVDEVLGPEATQEEVFQCASPIIQHTVENL
jgi:hypothetical protein